MSRTRPAALVAPGALSALVAVLIAGPGVIDAGAPPARPPLARTESLTFDAELVRSGKEVTVRIHARSTADGLQRCSVRTALYHEVDNPMARVITRRRSELWTEVVALRVPAGGEALREIRLPAAVVNRLPAERGPEPGELKELRRTSIVGVDLLPECSAVTHVG